MNISFPDVSWENLGEEDVPSKVYTNLVFRTTKQEAIDDPKCIAFEASIMKLLHMAVGMECCQCKRPLTFTTTMYATCMMVQWKCLQSNLHTSGVWASQPNLFGMKAGNLLVPVCHMLSGNSYVKTALFAKFLKLGFVGEANYYRQGCMRHIFYILHITLLFNIIYYYLFNYYNVIIISSLML